MEIRRDLRGNVLSYGAAHRRPNKSLRVAYCEESKRAALAVAALKNLEAMNE